ncbi:adenosylcobinamide-GDP ribazoletransferase [Youxingia wuxianensis]|uniref:Adenosylcobinamide-GDP ribazoletransferase n=1 Tax=Youxingia wuxianensis TaxID=2763678 RepID=A0A926ENB6_9FIRM|nr:adenosylcobinamide-GDP ribazoletransferase [Youxingia wuxianensis]MBC8585083.1 adenosylcobinamide-GDP ribazoletransferase [Youxingia wuxianensis]
MKQLASAFAIAFSMYSVLPMPQVDWKRENMKYAMCFFPWIGLVIGGAVYGWLYFAGICMLQESLVSAVAAALPVLLSGGIHLDGFCDTIDALASHQTKERKLEILKDPHIGSFAVIGCCLYFLLSFALWSQMAKNPKSVGIILIGYILSRSLSGLSVVSFSCAKNSGLACAFSDSAAKMKVKTVMIVYLVLCLAAMAFISPFLGIGTFFISILVYVGYQKMCYKQFGGLTGDLAGYFLIVCEFCILLYVCAAGGVIQ